jgi:hypothetical protein
LCGVSKRNFAIVTPPAKLNFIDHPRYGKVYPVVCYSFDKQYFNLPCAAFLFHSFVNSVVLGSIFIQPIFTAAAAGFFHNPMFVLPSLYYNYVLHQKYYVNFYGARSHVQNIYLTPSGKQVYIETRDGLTKLIDNTKFYESKRLETKYEKRHDFGHGANNYLYMKGNTHVYDEFVLDAVLTN